MIYDLCMFYDETDLFDIRYHTLKDVVDVFVVCEATLDFRKRPKPLNLYPLLSIYPKVRYLVLDESTIQPIKRRRWDIEFAQRRYLINGIQDAQPDDIIMLSDVDEIPHPNLPELFMKRSNKREWRGCRFTQYVYWMNGLYSYRIPCTVISTRRWIQEKNDDLEMVREQRRHGELIGNAGWHFHAIGGAKAVQKKLSITAHVEFDTKKTRDAVNDRVEAGIWYAKDNGMRIQYVPIDDRFPEYATKHYRHLFREI